jgi:DNA-binding transcriptional ArsR family regulator
MVKYSEKQTNRLFKALADPTRRQIVEKLAHGEATAGKLAEPFQISAPAITRHLKVLEEAELIGRTRRGKEHHFNFNPEGLKPAQTIIEELTSFWSQRLENLDTFIKQSKKKA